MRNTADYDPYIHEIHHRQKADSPSGTALRLGRILLQRIDRKKRILTHPPEGKIPPEMLHVDIHTRRDVLREPIPSGLIPKPT